MYQSAVSAATCPLTIGPALDPHSLRKIRNTLALEHSKWDPQVGDRSALFPQPLFVSSDTWAELARWSEAMAAEIAAAEDELSRRSELHRELGLPFSLRRVLKRGAKYGFTPGAVRVLRFDFHHTTASWKVSEVNSDVPGGFTEASAFTELMALHFPGATTCGNPLKTWTQELLSVTVEGNTVALLSAPGYMEDQQVTACLANSLRRSGVAVKLIHDPRQLEWKSSYARIAASSEAVSAVVRFYQGEWLCRFWRPAWENLFVGGRTPVSNYGLAILSESKRLPLIWEALETPMSICRSLFPRCIGACDGDWQDSDEWVVKAAFSNTGDHVYTRDRLSRAPWQALCRQVVRQPRGWVIQRRFFPTAFSSEMGSVFPCIGVYVIDGKASGVYSRVASEAVVDYRAMDAAMLIADKQAC